MTITHENTLTNKQKDMELIHKDGTISEPVIVSKLRLQELKRLQLEINKYSKIKKDLVLHYIGTDQDWTDNDEKIHKECYDIIESNTARIAEIILNEL